MNPVLRSIPGKVGGQGGDIQHGVPWTTHCRISTLDEHRATQIDLKTTALSKNARKGMSYSAQYHLCKIFKAHKQNNIHFARADFKKCTLNI